MNERDSGRKVQSSSLARALDRERKRERVNERESGRKVESSSLARAVRLWRRYDDAQSAIIPKY